MTQFIVRIELHPSDPEQAQTAVHDAMEQAGFSRIHTDTDGTRYHLPSSEYQIESAGTAETVRASAMAAVTGVTTHFMLLLSETRRVLVAGLVPVQATTRPAKEPVTLESTAHAA